MFNTSNVQPRTPINREQALSGVDARELRSDFGCRGNLFFGDDGNPGLDRNAIQGKVAADPAGTARWVWIDFLDVSNEIIN
jgi:hypothetical protein